MKVITVLACFIFVHVLRSLLRYDFHSRFARFSMFDSHFPACLHRSVPSSARCEFPGPRGTSQNFRLGVSQSSDPLACGLAVPRRGLAGSRPGLPRSRFAAAASQRRPTLAAFLAAAAIPAVAADTPVVPAAAAAAAAVPAAAAAAALSLPFGVGWVGFTSGLLYTTYRARPWMAATRRCLSQACGGVSPGTMSSAVGPRAKSLEFQGCDSSRSLKPRGDNTRSIGNFQEI